MNQTVAKTGALIVTVTVFLFAVCKLMPFDLAVILSACFWPLVLL